LAVFGWLKWLLWRIGWRGVAGGIGVFLCKSWRSNAYVAAAKVVYKRSNEVNGWPTYSGGNKLISAVGS
jgi:hypothetical protein